MRRILVVEDSVEMGMLIRAALALLSVEIDLVETIAAAKELVDQHTFSLFIFDLRLPDGDSLSLVSYVRSLTGFRDTPIMMLSASTDLECKVSALRLGADDYLCKPFQPLELRARIERMLDRGSKAETTGTIQGPGGMVLDPSRNVVQLEGGKLTLVLSNKEFRLLMTLARRPETHFSRQQLLDLVWGSGVAVTDRTIDTHIYAIRKKLGEFGHLIKSVPGVGYTMSSLAN